MRKYVIGFFTLMGVFLLGVLTQPYFKQELKVSLNKKTSISHETTPLYWVAPMDPNYRRDKPGKSPMGMALVPIYADSDSDGITIASNVEQNLGVQTIKVTRQTLARQINTVGYVTIDENQIKHVHSYTEGWIKRLLVKTTGEHVKKGQLLFELYSPTLINAQEEYLLAFRDRDKTLVKAAHDKLLTLGVDESQIQELKKTQKAMSLIKVFAPSSGIVSELKVREGMHIQPNVNVLTIENLTPIWVIGEVFERQAAWVKEGQEAKAHLPYLSGKQWQGKVDYIYPRLDPMTHTLKIRLSFDNINEVLKPNMYADITIAALPKKNVLVIPRHAVIYTGEGARVIVSQGQGKYVTKPVQLGIESGDKIAVLSGLTEGESVVTSAQFLIDSESSLKASFERMDASKLPNSQDSNH